MPPTRVITPFEKVEKNATEIFLHYCFIRRKITRLRTGSTLHFSPFVRLKAANIFIEIEILRMLIIHLSHGTYLYTT